MDKNSMAFEPLGHGSRWYDRLGGRNLKPKEFAVILLVVVTLAILWEFS